LKKILFLLIIIILMLTGCRVKIDNQTEGNSKEKFDKCKKYLQNLGKACEIFASHNNGHYPQNIEQVNPYIKSIPLCPACKKPYIYSSQTDPDFFIIKCGGKDAHLDTKEVDEGNYPVFNSKEGLVVKGKYTDSIASTIKPTVSEVPEKTPSNITTVTELPKPTEIPTEVSVIEVKPAAKEHNSKGLGYIKEKKYDLAMEEFNKALEISPDYIEAIKNKGNVYYYLGDTVKALEWYELTVSKDPSYWNGYNNMGNVYYEEGDMVKAEEYYSKAAELCKDDVKPFNNLGDILIEGGRYEEAIENYNKAIALGLKNNELYSQSGFAYWQIAQGYTKENKKDEAWNYANKALDNYNKAGEENPDDPVPYFRAGIIYFNFGPKYIDKAIECMNKAVEKSPDNYKYLYARGQVYEGKGDTEKAKKDYEKALKLAEKEKDKEYVDKITEALKK